MVEAGFLAWKWEKRATEYMMTFFFFFFFFFFRDQPLLARKVQNDIVKAVLRIFQRWSLSILAHRIAPVGHPCYSAIKYRLSDNKKRIPNELEPTKELETLHWCPE